MDLTDILNHLDRLTSAELLHLRLACNDMLEDRARDRLEQMRPITQKENDE